MMLNPSAPCFVPLSGTCIPASTMHYQHPYLLSEDTFEYLTATEVDELEACDEWCELVAYLDELEHDHMVALALMHAPQHKLSEIEKRAACSFRQRGPGSGNHMPVSKRPASSRQSRVRAKGVGGLFQPQKTN